jgi:hypothetical protein
MRYEMKNFVKTTKKTSQVRPFERSEDWKRERKLARKTKQQMQKRVA